MVQGDPSLGDTGLKPVKPLAVRYNDTRRALKLYKEQLKLKSRRSRLLIIAIADKLNEKESEVTKIRREADTKLCQVWQQLMCLQSSLSKEQVRLSQLLQDKENIIQSQRQEISKLRLEVEAASSPPSSSSQQGSLRSVSSFRRAKRERSSITRMVSSTEDGSESSPDSTPKGKNRTLSRQLSADYPSKTSDISGLIDQTDASRRIGYKSDSGGLTKDGSGLSRQTKFTKSSERPQLKSGPLTLEENMTPKGILKQFTSDTTDSPTDGMVKPPVPSRIGVNEKLKSGGVSAVSSDDSPGSHRLGITSYRRLSSHDSGNSSLDSSDPSNSLEWRLSVRSTLSPNNNNNNNNVFSNLNNNNNTPGSVLKPGPMLLKKPPPPPRRSKSHERPITNRKMVKEQELLSPALLQSNIQQNFEEYDLSSMDLGDKSANTSGGLKTTKRVSFSSQELWDNSLTPSPAPRVPLRKMPSYSSLTFPSPPSSLTFPIPDQKPVPSLRTLDNLRSHVDSGSVISKLLTDHLISSSESEALGSKMVKSNNGKCYF